MTDDSNERLNMLAFNALQGNGPLTDIAECLRGGVVAYPVIALLADLIAPEAAHDRPKNRLVMIDHNGKRLDWAASTKRLDFHAAIVGLWVGGRMAGWKTEAIIAEAEKRFGIKRAALFNHMRTIRTSKRAGSKITITVEKSKSMPPAES